MRRARCGAPRWGHGWRGERRLGRALQSLSSHFEAVSERGLESPPTRSLLECVESCLEPKRGPEAPAPNPAQQSTAGLGSLVIPQTGGLPEKKKQMNPIEWCEKYLSGRSINLELAKALGVKILNGSEIDTFTGGTDGHKMGAAILFNDVARRMQSPIHVKNDDDRDDYRDLLYRVPAECEKFCGEWRYGSAPLLPQR